MSNFQPVFGHYADLFSEDRRRSRRRSPPQTKKDAQNASFRSVGEPELSHLESAVLGHKGEGVLLVNGAVPEIAAVHVVDH